MHIRPQLALSALAALAIQSTAYATPVATARTYSINGGDQPYFDDASQSALLSAEENLLRGLEPVAVEGAIRAGYGTGGTYWETQAASPSCLTDGTIPTHEDTGNWNKQSNARWLVSDNSTLTWSFDAPEDLGSVRFWTQWPDGCRTDIAVSSIQVTTDGETWTTLPNSAFCSGRNTGDAVVQNTIQPYLDGQPHFRMVEYRDERGQALASDITGLRIVFPEQELGYTCFWEIEAKASTPEDGNTYRSLDVAPFDLSAGIRGAAASFVTSGTAVFHYGTDAENLAQSATFAIGADGAFSGTLTDLAAGTDYFWNLEIYEEGIATGFGAGSFRTLAYEPFGDCAIVNGLPSADGTNAVISFRENGRVRFTKQTTLDLLVVGGGGGGGNGGYFGGGGGGAGGVVYVQQVTLPAGDYDVTVGIGGAEDEKGTDSLFASYRAYGGGAGNSGFGGPAERTNGGSGGGAAAVSNWERYGGTGIAGQGCDGGDCLRVTILSTNLETTVIRNYSGQEVNAGGGGGGAGAVGGSGSFIVKEYRDDNGTYTGFCEFYYGGSGGDGIACSITGEEVWYGGGGGGGLGGWYRFGSEAPGGQGGGGRGGAYQDWKYDGNPEHGSKRDGENGVDGTGGGGGGGGSNGDPNFASDGGRGGSGIVILRFAQSFAEDSREGAGGSTVVRKDGYVIHTFTESGTFELPDSTYADVLLVGGGGGGGNGYGSAGGGGAGGMMVKEGVTLLAGKHSVTVGAGGLGGVRGREAGENGGDTSFNGWTALGGGGGGGIWDGFGLPGGSGGGAFYSDQWQRNNAGGAGVEGQGHDGGSNVYVDDGSKAFGAGGGGAGEAGYSATTSGPGKGGDGLPCDISGEEVWYAGGGAGGGNANVNWTLSAQGGKGGGGSSGCWPNGTSTLYDSDGEAYIGHAVNGTGGGGGGGAMWGNGNNQGPGGNGGSGIVIIRYKLRPSATVIFVR